MDDCYEMMKYFGWVDSDGNCDGLYDIRIGAVPDECTQCPLYIDNRDVNILGDMKKILKNG